MKHQEGFFTGVRDARIFYQCWLPKGKAKAVLLIVHGVSEHSGRYMNLVNHVVPLGYAVYGFDHLGHGKSEGTRVYVKRFADYTDTLKIYYDMIRDWQPEGPIFLVGHSMGGLIGALYLLDHQADLTGAVLSGPALKVAGGISPAVAFAGKVLSAVIPTFGVMGLEADGVSRDPAVVKAYLNDPLVYTGKITARWGAESLKAMGRIAAGAGRITLPILILQGDADRVVDPDGARMLYAAISSPDKTIKVYDGFYHEVFNEPEHDQVLRDCETWLEAHLGT